MANATQAGPPLEELVDDFIERAKSKDPDDHPSIGELEDALEERLKLLAGADPVKAIRAGAALARLANFGRIYAKAARDGGVIPDDDDLDTMDVEAMRDELARDLTYAINAAGEWANLEVIERATAIRDLTEAYVRLGGELLLAPRVHAPGAAPPIRDNEDLLAAIWRRLNELELETAGGLSTNEVDAVVAVVRAELERPVTEERQA